MNDEGDTLSPQFKGESGARLTADNNIQNGNICLTVVERRECAGCRCNPVNVEPALLEFVLQVHPDDSLILDDETAMTFSMRHSRATSKVLNALRKLVRCQAQAWISTVSDNQATR